MPQSLRGEHACAGPVLGVTLTLGPRYFAVVQIVHDQAGLAVVAHAACNLQIIHVDASALPMPGEERFAQVFAQSHEAEEAAGRGVHVGGRRHQDAFFGVPLLVLRERQRRAAQ